MWNIDTPQGRPVHVPLEGLVATDRLNSPNGSRAHLIPKSSDVRRGGEDVIGRGCENVHVLLVRQLVERPRTGRCSGRSFRSGITLRVRSHMMREATIAQGCASTRQALLPTAVVVHLRHNPQKHGVKEAVTAKEGSPRDDTVLVLSRKMDARAELLVGGLDGGSI